MRFTRKISKLNDSQFCITIPVEANRVVEKMLNKTLIIEINNPTIQDLGLLDKETMKMKEQLSEWMKAHPDLDVTDVIKDED